MPTLLDHLHAAVRALNAGRAEDAAVEARAALTLDPDHPDGLRLLGLAERYRGNLARAVELVERAVRLNPDFAQGHHNLGSVYEAAGRFLDAAVCFHRALTLDPGNTINQERYEVALAEETHRSLGLPVVGPEVLKTYRARLQSGFFARYLSGAKILDIGYKGDFTTASPIVPQAVGIDADTPGYDGLRLPFADGSQDAVFSSHCLEHMPDPRAALAEWYRVVRVGGHLVIMVPHQHLYERKARPPSRWNQDHKHFFTPAVLLATVEQALPVNGYRVRRLVDNDFRYDYAIAPDRHPRGCYEIELVLEKIAQPAWGIEG